ncbi:hypothetical protein HYY74_04580 [Candidatus Woesearchaeota archaeon]|nr:hypothetical protein [Candidatus Woesearchaeota archaeon]
MTEPEIHDKSYQELMELIFRDKYKLKGVTTKMKKIKDPDQFESYNIFKLTKNGSEVLVRVTDKLAFDFAFHHEYLPDELDGKTFVRIDNKQKYYDDIKNIAEDFDEKVTTAIKKIVDGNSEIAKSTEIDKLLEEFITTPDAVLNHKFIPIKENFHETYAKLILEGQNYITICNQAKEKSAYFKKYNDILNNLGRNFFNQTPMSSYRNFRKIVATETNRFAEKTKQQAQYIDFLFKGAAAISPVPFEIGCFQMLDAYRRSVELVRNPIRDIRRIIQTELNVPVDSDQLNYDQDLEVIQNQEKYKELVSAIKPLLRNSESHLFTRIDKSKGIIYIEHEPTKSRFEFSPQDLMNKREEIFKGFVPALMAFYAGTDVALKLIAMRSPGFLYRVIVLGNTKK